MVFKLCWRLYISKRGLLLVRYVLCFGLPCCRQGALSDLYKALLLKVIISSDNRTQAIFGAAVPTVGVGVMSFD